jgi:hypothetical protein
MSKQLKLAKEQRFQELESTMMKGRKRDRMKVMRAIHATESSEPAAVGLAVFALAHDEEESVRQAAVGILTNVDTTDATQSLAEAALSDDDDLTRYQCVGSRAKARPTQRAEHPVDHHSKRQRRGRSHRGSTRKTATRRSA